MERIYGLLLLAFTSWFTYEIIEEILLGWG